jgi:Reverse transcriptase (RNA-dependent DNA polymerase)/GAG-pre-integrase domain
MWTTPGSNKYQSFHSEVSKKGMLDMCFTSEIDDDVNDVNNYAYEEVSTDMISNVRKGKEYEDNNILDISIQEEINNDDHPSKITPTEELLIWHNRLTHMPMRRIQRLAQRGILPKRLSKCDVPLCPACLYGKITRRSWRTNKEYKPITPQNVKPGQMVSVDQIQSNTAGFIGQLKGTPTRHRYSVATVFVDHCSDYTFVFLQSDTTSDETLKSKLEFERISSSFGITVSKYHTDNGRFIDNAWMNDAKRKNQMMTMCGVNAHHQNSIVERRIRQLQDITRTSLLQASMLWSDAINSHLWSYAIRKACDDINNVPHHTKEKSPLEIFSGVNVMPNINNNHPFGCPVFLLEDQLQSGHKIPKWDARSRMGIYLGPSIHHARNIGLVLNLSTACESPAFHTKYDETFTTVSKSFGSYVPRSLWQIKCGLQEEPDHPEIFNNNDLSTTSPSVNDTRDITSNHHFMHNSEGDSINVASEGYGVADHDTIENTTIIETVQTEAPNNNDNDSSHGIDVESNAKSTRSGRVSRPPKRFKDYYVYETILDDTFERYYEGYAASSDPDVMYYHEILKEPDKEMFMEAMRKEINQHNERKNWVLTSRADVPEHLNVLPSVWSMRRKRDLTTGTVIKWKAKLNVNGSKQQYGIDYMETYAPVASWSSIRLVLLLSCLNGWKRRQVDFVQVFPQAPVENELYIEIPRGCNIGEKESTREWVLRVINNIYGQKQAGKVWYDHVTDGLINKLKFKQSKHDPCLLWRGSTMLIIYTDDTIITGPDEEEISQMISDISALYDITTNDEISDFLGVNINIQNNGYIELTQQKLIQSILKDLGLNEHPKVRRTPALSTKILHAHDESPPMKESWSFRMIIGKLNYLEKSYRPDISYAVHQCARFAADPRVEHAKAIKSIGRYLSATKNKGILFKPNQEGLICYSDADFSGHWRIEDAEHNPTTAKLRTGYVIKYGGCPLIWASKLQSEIALSSTESEYIALSQSLREVIPLMELIKELQSEGFSINDNLPTIHLKPSSTIVEHWKWQRYINYDHVQNT